MSAVKIEFENNWVALPDSSSEVNGGGVEQSAALEASFNNHMRPLLDVVDRLRALGVMEEGINLPTIVVVGDQSSGKSSVLESLAGITLPKGQGIVTRVPIILRIRKSNEMKIFIDYNGTKREIRPESLVSEIEAATNALAGSAKGITNTPVTVDVNKPNTPDLTMVDLPGITRVPVQGQPSDIYEQIASIIRLYIAPEESIILNVLSAAVDFTTCESIKMSQEADKTGERTLGVVTKVDKCPEGLYEKVTDDVVHIGLGYVCVRNKTIEDSSYEEARRKEESLFQNHPSLCKLDRSMVGIPALADKLMRIQADSIAKLLPKIVSDIDKKLRSKQDELEGLSEGTSNPLEAHLSFIRVVNGTKKTLEQILLEGRNDIFPDDLSLHYTARLHELFRKFGADLQTAGGVVLRADFIEAIKMSIAEAQGVSLPNVVPQSVISTLVRSLVDSVATTCTHVVLEAHMLAQSVAFAVIEKKVGRYSNLLAIYKRTAQKMVGECKDKCLYFVNRLLDKERNISFTNNVLYGNTHAELCSAMETYRKSSYKNQSETVRITQGLGELNLGMVPSDSGVWETMSCTVSYWAVIITRLADEIPLEVRYALNSVLLEDVAREVMWQAVCGGGGSVEAVMAEDPAVAYRRGKLKQSVDVLSKCKGVVSEQLAIRSLGGMRV